MNDPYFDPRYGGIEMSKITNDDNLWYNWWLDTPTTPPGGNTAEEALIKPGNCVKSIKSENNGFPKYCGRLSKCSEDKCVVIGHNSSVSTKFVWSGTKQEYLTTWIVD